MKYFEFLISEKEKNEIEKYFYEKNMYSSILCFIKEHSLDDDYYKKEYIKASFNFEEVISRIANNYKKSFVPRIQLQVNFDNNIISWKENINND